ncbi:MAG TPA: tetratricopeptide repeat protein, partial [Rheinheimera sp.]|nr:tetratricopeptide repeat protein [Rheinheimera sp.]
LPEARARLAALKDDAAQSADFYLLRADYANQSGSTADAFSALQTSISKDPGFKRAWANLYELARQPQYSQAFITTAEQHLAATPDDAWLRRLLAEHHINHQAYAAARSHYQYLLSAGQFKDDPWLYNNLANTLLPDNAEQALAYAEQAEQLLNNNPRIQLTRAKALRELRQFDKALIVLRQAFAIDSTDAETNYLLADSLIQLDRKDEAGTILRNLVKTTSQQSYKTQAAALLRTIESGAQ